MAVWSATRCAMVGAASVMAINSGETTQGSTGRGDATDMTDLELQFLSAAVELVARQQELIPLVAQAIGLDPFEYWILGRRRDDPELDAIDRTPDGEWGFRFHGLELDIENLRDGRGVRVDFGPRGRRAFTPYGVGEFISSSRPPWRVFPELKEQLCDPRGWADHRRCVQLADRLVELGHFALAEPHLVKLIAEHTREVPGRGRVLDIPAAEMPDEESDLLLCDNLVLTGAVTAHA